MNARRVALIGILLAAAACAAPTAPKPTASLRVTLDQATCIGSEGITFFLDQRFIGNAAMVPGYSSPIYEVPAGGHVFVAAVNAPPQWPPAKSFPPIMVSVDAGARAEVLIRCGG